MNQQENEALSFNLSLILAVNSIFIALLSAILFFLEIESISNFSLKSPLSTRICGTPFLPLGAAFTLAALIFFIISSLAVLRVMEFKEYSSLKYARLYSPIGVLLTLLAIITFLFELSCAFGLLAIIMLIVLLILSPTFIKISEMFKKNDDEEISNSSD